jgi:CHAT domain-containing protein
MIAAILFAALSVTPRTTNGQHPGALAAGALRTAFVAGGNGPEIENVRRRFPCIEVMTIRVGPVSVDGSAAVASLDVMTRDESFPSHWLVRLRRGTSGWRVVSFDVRERLLAERVAAAPGAVARRALLAAQPELVTPELARRLADQSEQLDTRNDPLAAEELATLAREIAEDWGDLAGQARALRVLGRAFNSDQKLNASRRAYEEGHALAERAHDPALIAATLIGIASVRMRSGDFDRLREDFEEGLRLARSADDDRTAGLALQRLASLDQRAGRFDAALREYDQALVLARRAGDQFLEAIINADAGITYDYMNSRVLAYRYIRRGIELFRRAGNTSGVIRNLRNMADMEAWDKRNADAEKHLREVEILLRRYPNDRTSAFIAATRSTLALHRHDVAEADAACTKGIALAQRAGMTDLITTLTEQLARVRIEQRRYSEAAALANEAIERSRKLTPNFDVFWHALLDLGQSLARQGRITEARVAFTGAIGTIEGTRTEAPAGSDDQQAFFADKVGPYYEMFRTLIGGRPEEAIPWVERARARTLMEFLAARKQTSTRSITAAEQAEEAAIEHGIAGLNIVMSRERAEPRPNDARIRALERDLDAKRAERAVFVRRLYEAHPDLALARGDVPQASIAEIQKTIPPDGVALEYVCLSRQSWVIVLTRAEAPRIYAIPAGDDTLRPLIARFNAELASRGRGIRSGARRLYDLLVAPAGNTVRKKRVICIIPDVQMGNLPFQALMSGDGSYLLEHAALFYAPSLAFLAWRAGHIAPRPAAEVPRLLAFGNPSVSSETVRKANARTRGELLAPLPEAEQEVRALKRLYGSQATVRIGSSATEESFKKDAPHYRLLHLATHGMYDDSDAMYSHLVLSRRPDDAEDGLLEAREVAGLDLNADLVVLSACETGRGKEHFGEGMVGLSWALLAAGCDTAILTNFKVDSASSRDLMIAFHRRLVRHGGSRLSGRTATEALRGAELAMLRSKSRSQPFYWASFTAVGRGW